MLCELISRDDARAAGLKRFFTGEPCRNGHIAERYVVNNGCLPCNRAVTKVTRNAETRRKSKRVWRVSDPEKVRIHKRDSHQRNKATAKAWEVKNRAKRRSQAIAWYAERIEDIRARDRERYAENPFPKRMSSLRWIKNNPGPARIIRDRRRARKRGSNEHHTLLEADLLLKAQGCRCANCRCSIRLKRHKDHITPLSRGGSDGIGNIQWLCQACNLRKYNKDPIKWARENGRLL